VAPIIASFSDSSLRVSRGAPIKIPATLRREFTASRATRNKSRLGVPIENYTDPPSLPPRALQRAFDLPRADPTCESAAGDRSDDDEDDDDDDDERQPQPARTAHKFRWTFILPLADCARVGAGEREIPRRAVIVILSQNGRNSPNPFLSSGLVALHKSARAY
jgi:hypothetical protein